MCQMSAISTFPIAPPCTCTCTTGMHSPPLLKNQPCRFPKNQEGRSKNQQCRFPKNQGVVQKISKKSGKKSASERPKSEIENLGESMQMSEQRNSQVFAKCVQKNELFDVT